MHHPSLILAGLLLSTGIAAGAPRAQSVNCRSLEERITSPRWFSAPGSRLVVNPTGGFTGGTMTAPVAEELGPSLAMNPAFYHGEQPELLPMLWSWQPVAADGASRNLLSEGRSLLPLPEGKWSLDAATVSSGTDGIKLRVNPEANFGAVTIDVTVDLARTPYLHIGVPSLDEGAFWAVKVNSGKQAVDTYVLTETADTGDFVLDLRTVTRWKGRKTFKLRLFAVGRHGISVDFATVRFVGADPGVSCFRPVQTRWAPDRVSTKAESTFPRMSVETMTCMSGDSGITQRLHVTESGGGSLILRGYAPSGHIGWDSGRNTLILSQNGWRMALGIGHEAKWLGVSKSWIDALSGKYERGRRSGVWSVALDGIASGEDIVLSAAFIDASSSVSPESLVANTTNENGFERTLEAKEKAWNDRLNRVPRPVDFQLHQLDKLGTTPKAIRNTYYRAWAFLLSNILPPMHENQFDFPQVGCGKPSLWGEGHPRASQSSQWESFVAMQFLSYVDPQDAWSAFEGMMSLVDEHGTVGGEGLPSRHAQTAWDLYIATGDTKRLRDTYPALKRMLLWKASDPRWVYKGLTTSTMKDTEFVVHAIMDTQYAVKIAETLGMPGEAELWKEQRAKLTREFREWFWEKPGGPTFRVYDADKKQRYAPDNTWCIPGIVLPPDVLDDDQRASLLRLTKATFDPKIPFAFWHLTKQPSTNYTMRGMLQYGMCDEAVILAEALMRDVTRAGDFAEEYTQGRKPGTSGVTPSVFGAANIIDAALWHNGVITCDGLPIIVHLPNAVGVGNIRIRDKRLDVAFGSAGNDVDLRGDALSLLRLPKGFTAKSDGTQSWHGSIPIGEQVHLEWAGTK